MLFILWFFVNYLWINNWFWIPILMVWCHWMSMCLLEFENKDEHWACTKNAYQTNWSWAVIRVFSLLIDIQLLPSSFLFGLHICYRLAHKYIHYAMFWRKFAGHFHFNNIRRLKIELEKFFWPMSYLLAFLLPFFLNIIVDSTVFYVRVRVYNYRIQV